jgi:hypothetical protein
VSGLEQIFGDLHAGLAAAHHEHGAVELIRTPVVRHVELLDLGGQPSGVVRLARNVLKAARDNDRACDEPAARRVELPHRSHALGPIHLDPLVDRKVLGEPLEPAHEVPRRGERSRRGVEELARHEIRPPGCVQAERVPALRLPGPADPAAFEDDMVRARSSEPAAHGQSGRAGSDHGHADPVNDAFAVRPHVLTGRPATVVLGAADTTHRVRGTCRVRV